MPVMMGLYCRKFQIHPDEDEVSVGYTVGLCDLRPHGRVAIQVLGNAPERVATLDAILLLLGKKHAVLTGQVILLLGDRPRNRLRASTRAASARTSGTPVKTPGR